MGKKRKGSDSSEAKHSWVSLGSHTCLSWHWHQESSIPKKKKEKKEKTEDSRWIVIFCSLNVVRGQHEYLQQAQQEHDLSSDIRMVLSRIFTRCQRNLTSLNAFASMVRPRFLLCKSFCNQQFKQFKPLWRIMPQRSTRKRSMIRLWSNSVMLPS